MNERQILEQFRVTPEGQRLLQAIRFAEGTAGPKGYQTLFGGGTVEDLTRHPDKVISSGGYKSAAAGAYQFLPGTWNSVSNRLGLQGFGPKEQDIAALSLARQRLMPLGGLAALKREGLSSRVSAALSPEWASFPTESGKSYYGQPVKKLEDIQRVYGGPITQVSSATGQSTASVDQPENQQPAFKDQLSSLLLKYLGSGTQTQDPYTSILTANAAAEALEEQGTLEALEKADELRSSALLSSLAGGSSSVEPYTKLASELLTLVEQKDKAPATSPQQTAAGPQISPSGGASLKGAIVTSWNDTGGKGIDFVIPGGRGATFTAPFRAQVLKVVSDPRETNLERTPSGPRFYGNYVDLRATAPDGTPFDVRLAHFDKLNPNLKPGAVINPGTPIGTQGRTGSTTGAHVSADFYDPDKTTASSRVLAIKNAIANRISKGLPVF